MFRFLLTDRFYQELIGAAAQAPKKAGKTRGMKQRKIDHKIARYILRANTMGRKMARTNDLRKAKRDRGAFSQDDERDFFRTGSQASRFIRKRALGRGS